MSMNLAELKIAAQTCLAHGLTHMNVWTPQGWKPPKGFPRRELLCVPAMGGRTSSVDAAKLVKWCEAQS